MTDEQSEMSGTENLKRENGRVKHFKDIIIQRLLTKILPAPFSFLRFCQLVFYIVIGW